MKFLRPLLILIIIFAFQDKSDGQDNLIENFSFEENHGPISECGNTAQFNEFNGDCLNDPNADWSWHAASGRPSVQGDGNCHHVYSAVFAANDFEHDGENERTINGSSIFYTFPQSLEPGKYGLTFCLKAELFDGIEGTNVIVALAKNLQNVVSPNTVGTHYEIYDAPLLPRENIPMEIIGSPEPVTDELGSNFSVQFTVGENSAFDQLWFYGTPLSEGRSKICIDKVVLSKCDEEVCQEVKNLTSCSLTDKTGYIDLLCGAGSTYTLEAPEGSTAITYNCEDHFIITNATAGTYTIRIQNVNGCITTRTYEVVETCCMGGLGCPAPTNLGCKTFSQFNVTVLTWDPVPDALGYELYIYPGECGQSSFPVESVIVSGNSYNTDAIEHQRFAWAVRTICPDESLSDYSALVCFDSSECGAGSPEGFSKRLENEDVINLKPTIFPNPNKGVFNIELSDYKKSDRQANIQIFNQTGVLVFQKEVQESKFTVNLKEVPPGIYHAVISSNNQIVTEKFIIQ